MVNPIIFEMAATIRLSKEVGTKVLNYAIPEMAAHLMDAHPGKLCSEIPGESFMNIASQYDMEFEDQRTEEHL